MKISPSQTVEKPLTGFSDKFLQSAARTPCSPMANNSHCDALRAACGGDENISVNVYKFCLKK